MDSLINKNISPLRERIYHQLVYDISHGRINAGERLSEETLCKRFFVSKTPVREAFIQLEREGYIILKKNVGAVVQRVSRKVVDEIFTIVAVLESYALRIVVEEGKIQKSEMRLLDTLVADMKRCSKMKKYEDYRQCNEKFHEYFLDKLGNETMRKIIMDLRRRVYSSVVYGLTIPVHIDDYVQYHKKILEAAKQGNADKASVLMRDHVMKSKRNLLEAMENFDNSWSAN